ncbi:MAG: hypothetical protein GX613_09775 [Chloroflexi bacterium]|nr:hypothetical protein [Chloroflexota bacterium]
MNTMRRLFLILALLAVLALPLAATSAAPNKAFRAYAEWFVNPSGCRYTLADVLLTQTTEHTPPGPPSAAVTLELRYHVRSTCEDEGDNLFYYEFHTEGPVTIPAGDFSLHPGLKWASLNTTVPVFDEESGSHTDLTVWVNWTTPNKLGPHHYSGNATIEVAAPFDLQYADSNPIEQSVVAELLRLD